MNPTHLSRLPFRFAHSVVKGHSIKNGFSLELKDNTGGHFLLEITAYEPSILRIRLYLKAFHPPFDSCIQENNHPTAASVQLAETPNDYQISTQGFRLSVGKSPYSFQLYTPEGKLIVKENLQDVNAVGSGEDQVPPLGFSYNHSLQPVCANLCFSLGVYEQILGLGERFSEYNKRGQMIQMKNSDALGVRTQLAYKNIPFYLSSSGYGLFLNTTSQAEFHIGTRSHESLNIHAPGSQLEYFLFTGSPAEIVSAFTRLTGPAALPPDWSFGTWYSNSFKASTQQEVEADAQTLLEKNLPCQVIHLDCYWLRDNCWCDFVWNKATYPNHQQMIKRLKSQGYKLSIWINPYITIVSPLYKEGADQEYFVKNKQGTPYTADLWHGLLPLCAMVDFTNPHAASWFAEKVRGLLHQGIDAIKTDFGEDIPPDSCFFNGKTGEEMRNLYARLYNETVAQVCKQEKGEDALVWARSGCAGMQRHPVCWSGDPHSSYSGMASVLKSGLSMGISGVPFWSHDIGGFFGLDENSPESRQLLVRWAQFGLLSSHSRFHGTTTRQPWAFGSQVEAILRDFMQLRQQLMPYILKTARECVQKGLPFLLPMVLACPQDEQAAPLWDQYMIGSELLVAPVFGPHNTTRQVYLPAGTWQHHFTRAKYTGGQTIQITSPLEQLPLFTKFGGTLAL